MFRKIFIYLIVIGLWSNLQVWAHKCVDVSNCEDPPFTIVNVKPNVLLVMDFSGSMQFPAYYMCEFDGYYSSKVADCGDPGEVYESYDSTKTYYGYFDSDKYYKYNSTDEYWEVNDSCTNTDKIGSGDCISGNLLNWLIMSRIDSALKALIGGKGDCDSESCILRPQGSRRYITDQNLHCIFFVRPETYYSGDYQNKDILIDVYNEPGYFCQIGTFTDRYAKVKIDKDQRTGIIQKNFNAVRFGLMVYASNGRYGEIRYGFHENNIDGLINKLEQEIPYYGTPTGEALDEAIDYFVQKNKHSYENNHQYMNHGSEVDPYCKRMQHCNCIRNVWCRKNYLILISDGEWNGNVDPVIPAYYMHTHDLRDDLENKQIVQVYALYAFSDSEEGIRSMENVALYGGFTDIDDNDWPFNVTDYPNPDSLSVDIPNICSGSNRPDGCQEWDTDPIDGLPDHFYQVSGGQELELALTKILESITQMGVASVVASGSEETIGNDIIIRPAFSHNGGTVIWRGHLQFFKPDSEGNYDFTNPDYDANTKKVDDLVTKDGLSISCDDLELNGDSYFSFSDCNDLIQWLKGESWSKARDRKGYVLGDIIYSSPVVKKSGNNFYIFVGANDGMLHMFKWNGTNVDYHWGYVPSNLLSELKYLAYPDYGQETSCSHLFMVDLSPEIWNVNGKSILIGGEREGGDVYFAIDVTDPNSPHPLWEFSVVKDGYEITTNYNDLKNRAFTYSQPYVSRLSDSLWVAFTGGNIITYDKDSLDDKFFSATLFGINIDDGSRWIYKDLGKTCSANENVPCAVASPIGANIDKDPYDELLFFGDLCGNFYTCRITSTNIECPNIKETKNIGTTNPNRCDRQPITIQPTLAWGSDGKLHIYFGTGKFDTTEDKTDDAIMSIYSFALDPAQSLTNETCSSSDSDLHYWIKSDGTPDGNECFTCIYDLSPGERVLDRLRVIGGYLLFTTFIPSDDPCDAGGESYLYVLDYMCRPLTYNPLETENPSDIQEIKNGNVVIGYKIKLGSGLPSRPEITSDRDKLIIQEKDRVKIINLRLKNKVYFRGMLEKK